MVCQFLHTLQYAQREENGVCFTLQVRIEYLTGAIALKHIRAARQQQSYCRCNVKIK